MLSNVSVGDEIPYCLMPTLPFHGASTKKKKKRAKQKKFVLVASNTITAYNVSDYESAKAVGTFQGHASRTRLLRMTDDNQYLVSAGQGRHVYVWRCTSFFGKRPKAGPLKSATFSLALDSDVVSLDVRTVRKALSAKESELLAQIESKNTKGKKKSKKKSKETHKNVYLVCAASKSTAFVWALDPLAQYQAKNDQKEEAKDEEGDGEMKSVVELSVCDDGSVGNAELDGNMSWIRHVQFVSDCRLMVMRGTPTVPILRQIAIVREEESEEIFLGKRTLENVTASVATRKMDLTRADAVQKQSAVDKHLTVLHVADGALANPKSLEQTDLKMDTKSKKRKRSAKVQTEDEKDGGEPATKRLKSEGVTFQDKLFEIEKKSEEQKHSSALRIPNADSLYTLLTQSLSANDEAMFSRLLGMQNDEAMRDFEGAMIKNTLGRISSSMAVELLARLVAKFRVSPRSSVSILRWLLPLLNSHSATFAKDLASRKHLVSVHQAIDYQIKSLMPAMKLQGRLSLLMNQMNKVSEYEKNKPSQSADITRLRETMRDRPLFVHDESKVDTSKRHAQDGDEKTDDGFIRV